MRFLELLVVNIRSYTKQKIVFPEGRVLLAGDIGSGKSTILLAMEFALFGIIRGAIRPSSVLRHGVQTGLVELVFEVNKQVYTVRRVLKRTNSSVEQESGHLIVNGQKKEGTATELKTWILELLGYPLDVAGKSTALMYRYTVYTPQEEMKHILFDGAESRLSVLRKIFDIEKYKIMGENAQTYVRVLRERKRMIEGQIVDLAVQCSQLESVRKEANAVQNEILAQKKQVEELQKSACLKEEELRVYEASEKVFLQKKQDFAVRKNECTLQQKMFNDSVNESNTIQQQLTLLEKELHELHVRASEEMYDQEKNTLADLEKAVCVKEEELRMCEKEVRVFLQRKQDLAVKNQEREMQQRMFNDCVNEWNTIQQQITLLEKELHEVQSILTQTPYEQEVNTLKELERKSLKGTEDIAQWKVMQEEHLRIKQDMNVLDFCPLCQQQVSHAHKNEIITKKISLVQELDARIKQRAEEQEKTQESVAEKKKNIDKLRELKHTFLMKEKHTQEKKQQKDLIEKKKESLNSAIQQNNIVVQELENEVKEMQEKEHIFEVARKNFKELCEAVTEKKKIVDQQRELKQIILVKEKHTREKKQQKEITEKKSEELQRFIQQNEVIIHQLEREMSAVQEQEQVWSAARKNHKDLQDILHARVVVLNRLFEKQQMLEKQVQSIADDVEKKQKLKQKKEFLEKKEQWLSEHFVPLMNSMERAVFAKVWNELNTYFVQWFQLLIEEEGLIARLDESCSPVIEQNGYETFVEGLSGGEKTSCALAYRLALNKVINDLMVTLQTKDVLILDEPTDGFSAEQLDRLKEVLDALDARQVILVSHEKKVEGFVDSVVRIGKTNHVSFLEFAP